MYWKNSVPDTEVFPPHQLTSYTGKYGFQSVIIRTYVLIYYMWQIESKTWSYLSYISLFKYIIDHHTYNTFHSYM